VFFNKLLEGLFNIGIEAMGKNWRKAGFDFVPLVVPEMVLQCSLDILILRPGDDRYVLNSGDIDGPVKTLFDALQMPRNEAEASGIGPQEDETPFYCLLENDRLISQVRVTSDHLLLLPQEREVRPNDSFVVIHVKLNHKSPRTFDNYFG
jgi:hypothetical protein